MGGDMIHTFCPTCGNPQDDSEGAVDRARAVNFLHQCEKAAREIRQAALMAKGYRLIRNEGVVAQLAGLAESTDINWTEVIESEDFKQSTKGKH